MTDGNAARSSWLVRVCMGVLLGAMIFGIGVGIYMTVHHEVYVYGGAEDQFALVGCAEAEGVSCDVVNTSEWSEVFGVPTFTWAIPTYLAMGWLAIQVLLGRRESLWLLLGAGVLTSLFSAFLYYISVVELNNVCLWCMRLYAVNGGALLLALIASAPLMGQRWPPVPALPSVGLAGGVFVAATALSVGIQQGYRATLLGDAPSTEALAVTTVEVPDNPLERVDPEGTLEPRTIQVQTEDGNTAELRIRETDAWKGNLDADVVLVEFADLECGYCKRASVELEQLYRAYGDRVLFVFKHFPMDAQCNPGVKSRKHRNACNAAMGAVCAQEQGRFWAYHDLGFKNQHALKPDALRANAEVLGLNMDRWNQCVRARSTAERVTASGEDGKAVDAHGTPRIFIDGKLYRAGASARQLAKALEQALGLNAAEARARQANLELPTAAPVAPIPPDVADMQTVRHGELAFRIDTFESALDNGKAVSGKHEIPATRMSWYAAKDACDAAGKRMCSEIEWLTACQGAQARDDDDDGRVADDRIEGTAYPYGDFHQPGRCWSGRNRETERPVYTGEMPGCVGPDGVYDQVGNVEEWAGSTPETAVLLGGAFDTRADKARCYRPNDTYGAGYANQRSGFRCCANVGDAQDSDEPPGVP